MQMYNGCRTFLNGKYLAYCLNGEIHLVHRDQAEKMLGRKLKKEEVVHHKDRNKMNNDIDNLMVFRTTADHTKYHNGCDIDCDSEGVYYAIDDGIKKICPICGEKTTKAGSLCHTCYVNSIRSFRKVSYPSKDELFEDISSMTYSAVASKYGVTHTTIRRWCKSYHIDVKSRTHLLSYETLSTDIKHKTLRSIATEYGITVETVRYWLQEYGIAMPKKHTVICKETQKSYDSPAYAARDVYPGKNVDAARVGIRHACKSNREYFGYHWHYAICDESE